MAQAECEREAEQQLAGGLRGSNRQVIQWRHQSGRFDASGRRVSPHGDVRLRGGSVRLRAG